jgi:hypothetical protein
MPNLMISTSQWFIEFAGNNTIGNIHVCYAADLPVSIVERS